MQKYRWNRCPYTHPPRPSGRHGGFYRRTPDSFWVAYETQVHRHRSKYISSGEIIEKRECAAGITYYICNASFFVGNRARKARLRASEGALRRRCETKKKLLENKMGKRQFSSFVFEGVITFLSVDTRPLNECAGVLLCSWRLIKNRTANRGCVCDVRMWFFFSYAICFC